MTDFKSFAADIRNLYSSKKHKVTGSHTIKEIHRTISKGKWEGIGRPVPESTFYKIIRRVNDYLAEDLLQGKRVDFPCKMGSLELMKRPTRVFIENGKVKTSMAVDWDKTIQLWYSDDEARANKTLVREPSKEIYRVYYSKKKAVYKNKAFYEFRTNRDVKRKLTKLIKNGEIDAYAQYETVG